MIFTTTIVMLLVLLLIEFLPDYASYEGEDFSPYLDQIESLKEQKNFSFNQYIKHLKNFGRDLMVNDFGFSRTHPDHYVGEIIRRESKISIQILVSSLILSVVLGGVLGILSGMQYGNRIEKFIQVLGTIFTCAPSFLLAPILIYIFSIHLKLLPAALWEGPQSLILPVVTLSLRPIFFLARILSEQLSENSKSAYVKVAMSKGLPPIKIWISHILPNSLTSFLVGIGNLPGSFLSGLFLVETLFALPGLGYLFVKSLAERDYPIFLALVLIFSVLIQLSHRLSDFIVSKFSVYQSLESYES